MDGRRDRRRDMIDLRLERRVLLVLELHACPVEVLLLFALQLFDALMQRRHLRLACDQRRRRVDVRRKAVARRSPALRREPFALGHFCLSVGIPVETFARRQASIGVLAPAPALAAAFLTAANARPWL